MKFQAKYLGRDGYLAVPFEFQDKFVAGQCYNITVAKARSTRQHNLLFRAIEVAFENWPEHHWFKPVNDDHLRYWLEVQAGWGTTIKFNDPRHAVRHLAMGFDEKMFPMVTEDGCIVVYTAQSIAYGKLGRTDFNHIVTEIDRVLQREAGFTLAECGLSATEDAR